MDILELWSSADRRDLDAVRAALTTGDLAGALLAVEGADAAAAVRARGCLDAWADAVGERLMVGADAVDSLRRVLVGDVALSGDRDTWFDPRNSGLAAAIERRRGLPITLSAIWMLVGERAGLPVDGLALPGHFIVQVGADPVDPYRRGQVMDVAGCEALVRRIHPGLAWDDRWLEPVDERAIVTRVLRNLCNAHARGDDVVALYRHARLLTELAPGDAGARLTAAHIARRIGDRATASALYRDVTTRFAGSTEADDAEERLRRMQADERWLH